MAANDKQTDDKAKKPSIFSRMGKGIAKFFINYKSELKKVVWPSRQDTFKQTSVVLISLVALATLIGVLDLIFVKLIELL